ncbi:probable splicing factor, arginine/serine-rich 5 isoform X3 [Xenopus laevis]|uniref:Probable splicing factor, arginine/serine-rich 5 isoform X3 n=1 Tax=Xenopus laevis TaxID=8355 RepID=A0A8J1MEU8_XENLA|nr:probable splicing factor, arginine/serine-rich 5 isoform X3 [Xenopus laevis]
MLTGPVVEESILGVAGEDAAATGPRQGTRGEREVHRSTPEAGCRAGSRGQGPHGDSEGSEASPDARPVRARSTIGTAPGRRSPRGAASSRAGSRDTCREWRCRRRDRSRSRSRSRRRCSGGSSRRRRVECSPIRERFISSGCLSPTRNPGRRGASIDRNRATRESRSRSRQHGRSRERDTDRDTAGRSAAQQQGASRGPGVQEIKLAEQQVCALLKQLLKIIGHGLGP